MGSVIFREERCKGCGLCVQFCPKKIVVLGSHFNSLGFHPAMVANGAQCIGCAVCAWMCPDLVIEVAKVQRPTARRESIAF